MELLHIFAYVILCLSIAALLQTYIIYPLFCAALGGKEHEYQPQEHLPGISVLVPAYNEEDVIEAKISNFLSLDYPSEKIEMIIVDDGSSDRTRELAEKKITKNIRLLDAAPRAGKATALNRMVEESQYPFLLLCDANVLFSADVPKRLARHMEHNETGAVTGEVKLSGSDPEFESGESLYYKFERRIQRAESRIGSVMGVDGGMYLLRKQLFKQLPSNAILDDFMISMQVIRSGYRIVYDQSIRASESGTPSSLQEYKRRVRMMSGVVQIMRLGLFPKLHQPVLWLQFISHKVLRWITPFLLLSSLLATAVLSLSNTIFSVLLVIQLFFYAISGITCVSKRLRRTPVLSIIFYFFMSQVAITEGLAKGLANRQNVLWEKAGRLKHKPDDSFNN